MLNLRKIDDTYWLSGGWTDITQDAPFLKELGIKYVLDLQMTDNDTFFKSAVLNISTELTKYDITYAALPMKDGVNENTEKLFNVGHDILNHFETKVKKRETILVKCGVGVSRSPAMLIYHFCERDRLIYEEGREVIIKIDQLHHSILPLSPHPFFVTYLKSKFGSVYDGI